MSRNLQTPDFIVHYNRSEPFRSVTHTPIERWPEVVEILTDENSWGIKRFSDPEYLVRRFDVELRLRDEFIVKGGRPKLNSPIYFFLGRHSQFEEHKGNNGYIVDLKDLSPDSISFTYGDSLLAYNEDYRIQSGEKYQNSLCTKIYRIEELKDLFGHSSFPKQDPLAIEVQLWETPSPKIVRRLDPSS